jgi:hypothetical protein
MIDEKLECEISFILADNDENQPMFLAKKTKLTIAKDETVPQKQSEKSID